MYINIQLFKKNNLEPQDLYFLLSIKQTEKEVLKDIPIDVIQRFKDLGILTTIKGTKSEPESLKIRLNDKGKKLLENLSIAEVEEDSLKIFDWISEIYRRSGKEIGNQKKTKQFIAQFSKESGIKKNSLAFLIQSFVNDESQFEWSKVLQYLFFKGDSVFNVRFDLYSSKLYQYYQKNENYFSGQFKKWEEQ
jgi:hypothetical protein